MTTRKALWSIIVASAALRLAWAASVGGYTNEAYYYMYAENLDWSYFDHPPMVALVSALGLTLRGVLPPELSLRLGFIALFAGSTWLLARLGTRAFGERAGVLAALALNSTIYYGMLIGTLSEPDGPFLFFWLLTMDRLWVALDLDERRTGSAAAWAGVGLAWGAALLSKYHAVLLPAGVVLYLAARPPARRCLRAPGPYLAAALGLLMFTPVIVWNSRHYWASFLFQGKRAGGFHGFDIGTTYDAIMGQALYLTPFIWAWLLAILYRLIRRGPRDWSAPEAFLACLALPALVLFTGVSTFRRIMPHWPLIGFVALMPLLGRAWSGRLLTDPRRTRIKIAVVASLPALIGTMFAVQARTGLFQDSKGRLLGLIAPQDDPTLDTIRWGQIAAELRRRHLLDEPNTFLFTDGWPFSSGLALATDRDRTSPVACYHRDARSFLFWSRPEDYVGRDGIFIRIDDCKYPMPDYSPWFTRIEPIGVFPIVRRGVTLDTARVFRCVRQTDPFLFGYAGPGPIPRPARAASTAPPAVVRRPTPAAPTPR